MGIVLWTLKILSLSLSHGMLGIVGETVVRKQNYVTITIRQTKKSDIDS